MARLFPTGCLQNSCVGFLDADRTRCTSRPRSCQAALGRSGLRTRLSRHMRGYRDPLSVPARPDIGIAACGGQMAKARAGTKSVARQVGALSKHAERLCRPGPVLTVQIREDRRIRITSVAVSAVAGSTVIRCPAIRRVDRCVVAVSVVGRSVVAISGAIVSIVTVWNASGQNRYQSNDYRQVFEHRRLRSAKVTRRIELRPLCKFESGASVPRSLRLWAQR